MAVLSKTTFKLQKKKKNSIRAHYTPQPGNSISHNKIKKRSHQDTAHPLLNRGPCHVSNSYTQQPQNTVQIVQVKDTTAWSLVKSRSLCDILHCTQQPMCILSINLLYLMVSEIWPEPGGKQSKIKSFNFFLRLWVYFKCFKCKFYVIHKMLILIYKFAL